MQEPINVYKNVLVQIPVTILSGQSLSPIVNSGQLPGGYGAALLLGVLFPYSFPAANVTIETSFPNALDPRTNLPYLCNKYFCTGFETPQLVIQTVGDGITNMDVSIIPYFLAPNINIQIKSSASMGQDVTIYLTFQPVIQGVA